MTPRELNKKLRAQEIHWLKTEREFLRVMEARSVKGKVQVRTVDGWIETEEVERGGTKFVLIAAGRTPFGQHYS